MSLSLLNITLINEGNYIDKNNSQQLTYNTRFNLALAEKEQDLTIKYWLAYSCCYIENGNFPNKSDGGVINRIHKLVVDIQSQNPIKETKENIDYLNEAYQIFKKWH